MIRNALLILAIATLSGCAIVPDSIEVPEGTQLVSYSKAVTAGSDAVGQTARWGGVIVGVENKPQKTWIEMVHFPLNHYGKPKRSEETIGRFKVAIDGFVDPITFEEGRSVTFLGTLTSPSAGMIGEQPYMYPTIDGLDYHMWRKETAYDVSTLYFNFATGWYSPFYSPFYRPHWGFHRSRIRVIERSNGVPGGAVKSRGNIPNTIGNSRQGTDRRPSEHRQIHTQEK
ncbi:Slp family lipoprotein [Alteromonas halophila]|uniref:Slp family lipoprotein n=1 Tax=Alteromonas halophila TaxID=516698 RepID=A0A918JQ44_9ALTE|nr:Slp family lipoprotein [Alteromonas halophila]GGW94833.1 hypothetical protein GCM10007391_31330 [Alteromonas halophila]